MLAAQQHAGVGPGKAEAFKRAICGRKYVPIEKTFGYRFPAPQLGINFTSSFPNQEVFLF